MGLAGIQTFSKAGVDFNGVHDWSVFLTERLYFGNLRCARRTRTPPSSWHGSPRPMPT